MELDEQILPMRIQIDALDKQILSLLNIRAGLAQKIGEIKYKNNSPVFKPEREKLIIQSLEKLNTGPLTNTSISNIWKEIMSSCRSLEGEVSVAFLGPSGTFSEQAMISYFGKHINRVSCLSLDEVFKTIETDQAQFAIVPIENSTEGAVSRTLDLLLSTTSKIIGEIIISVNHNLLSMHSDIKQAIANAKIISAHPQALAQCQQFLNNHPQLKNIERRAISSNALAAEMASNDDTILAIASEQAAKEYNLCMLKQYIQDDIHNRTRFIILGNTTTQATGNDQTSLIFSIHNEIGSILKAIEPFSKYNVSMSRLQSRPSKNDINISQIKDWEYHFLVDIDGHIHDEKVAKALEEIKKNVKFLKCLGSYAKI